MCCFRRCKNKRLGNEVPLRALDCQLDKVDCCQSWLTTTCFGWIDNFAMCAHEIYVTRIAQNYELQSLCSLVISMVLPGGFAEKDVCDSWLLRLCRKMAMDVYSWCKASFSQVWRLCLQPICEFGFDSSKIGGCCNTLKFNGLGIILLIILIHFCWEESFGPLMVSLIDT